MSSYEDDRLSARFATLAPRPLPADWDDVLERAHAVSARRRRLPRSPRRGGGPRKLVVALAAAVLVAAVAAAAYGTVRVLFLDRGFVGLPQRGASPSSPYSGELVAHWFGFSAALQGSTVRAWVYADGRVIWDWRSHGGAAGRPPEGANELFSGYLERRLTPEGLELVRSAVAELVDRTRPLVETIPADYDYWRNPGPKVQSPLFVPEGLDAPAWGSIAVREGQRLVRLAWQGLDVKEHLDLEGPIATPEQLAALRRVDALLTTPASVLPSSAWAVREVRAYVPSHYAVCIDSSPPKDASHLLSMLPSRAADLLRDKSRTSSEGDVVSNIDQEPGHMVVIGRSVTACYRVETEEAREVAAALSGLEREPGWERFALAYRVAEAVDNLNPTRIWFEPYFPHGQFTFSGPFG